MVALVTQFGAMLRSHRRRVGLTQQKLADSAQLSVRTVRDLESGRVAQPHRKTMQLLANALGLDGPALSALRGAATRAPLPTLVGDHPATVEPCVRITLRIPLADWQRMAMTPGADDIVLVAGVSAPAQSDPRSAA